MNTLTFALAVAAYVLLCASVALHAARQPRRALTVALAVVLVAHVTLVWAWRFGWSPSAALAKGIVTLVAAHSLLAVIVAAAFVPEPWSGRLLWVAWPPATFGALGAAFRYDFVAWTRAPLVLALAVTVLMLARIWKRR